MTTPRARFAPSPTGYLHVGSARTALFNWLFCRSVGGSLVLRIEDTDKTRNQSELVDNIFDALRWLGIDWDEGPFLQSERAGRHAEAVEQLLDGGHAYVDDGAVRFRVPDAGTTGWTDVIRGRVDFDNAVLEDFVIRRSDGSPMFLLANAVDDLDMGITHVIRGEDLVNTVPKQLLLMRALGVADDLVYAHLPLLVDAQRRKLSKRNGDVSVESYRQRGFHPQAFTNYLATLGWGTGDDTEIRPMAEIIEQFRIEDVNKSAAFFDVKKLSSFSGEYLRAMTPAAFLEAAEPWLTAPDVPWEPEAYDAAFVEALTPALQMRTRTLDELPAQVDWAFGDLPEIDEVAWDKVIVGNDDALPLIDGTLTAYEAIDWTAAALHEALQALGEGRGLKLGKAQAPVRVAVTGRAVGPPLFDALEALGRERSLARLRAARSKIAG